MMNEQRAAIKRRVQTTGIGGDVHVRLGEDPAAVMELHIFEWRLCPDKDDEGVLMLTARCREVEA